MSDRLEALRACPILADFTEVGLKILAAVAKERVFLNAQALQTQGETPKDQAVLFITRGRARCEVRNTEGQTLGLGTLHAGDHLGAMRLFAAPGPAPLSVIAEAELHALAIDRAALDRLQRQKPQTALKLLFALAADFGRRLGENRSHFADFTLYAAARANVLQQSSYQSYAGLGFEPTPSLPPTGE